MSVTTVQRLVASGLLLGLVGLPARLLAQGEEEDDQSGAIAAINVQTGIVTVSARGNAARRFEFLVPSRALQARLRPGQPVTVNLRTATGRLGGQLVRIAKVITAVGVTPKVRAQQLCSAQEAAMNAVEAALPPPTSLHWTCLSLSFPGNPTQYSCECIPIF